MMRLTDLVLDALLATTFTCVGILSLWAGICRWHWFIRTMAAIAPLAALMLIPAAEPFLFLFTQMAVVVTGAAVYRWWTDRVRNHPSDEPASLPHRWKFNFRFSLTTALLLTAVAAVLLAVVIKIDQKAWWYWREILATGIAMGSVVLVSAWLVVGSWKLCWRLPVITVLIVVACLTLRQFNYWPSLLSPLRDYNAVWVMVWPPVVISTSLLIGVNVALLRQSTLLPFFGCGQTANAATTRIRRTIAATTLFALIVSCLALPLYTVWQLLDPLPRLVIEPPEPNGFDDLVAASQMLLVSPVLNKRVEPANTDELADEIGAHSAGYDRIRLALSRDIVNPIWSNRGSLEESWKNSIKAMQAIRGLHRPLSMKAELARQKGLYDDVVDIALVIVHIGVAVQKNATFTEYLSGTTLEDLGKGEIYKVVGRLPPAICRRLIRELTTIESQREPIETVIHRNRVFSQYYWGWEGHFIDLVESLGGHRIDDIMQLSVFPRTLAVSRLLKAELALHWYLAENGHFPHELQQLVPEYLPEVPLDPFDPENGPLQYRLSGDGFILYSVGPNGLDDGGRGFQMTDGGRDWNTGDLRLDLYFRTNK